MSVAAVVVSHGHARELADLFDGRRQLIVYRAFYAPDVTTYPTGGGTYPERACVGCSFLADQVAHPAHLNARDTTLAFVSRGPIERIGTSTGWAGRGATPPAARASTTGGRRKLPAPTRAREMA